MQPDCYRSSADAPCDTPKGSKRLDLGPQIAVWVEKADGTFIDTLLVTNAVSKRGIGNRPGHWKFPSSWRFPYGKRPMVLPIWAHRRGKIYETLVMQDDDPRSMDRKELWLGFHESISSPDPYYCLPFLPNTWVFDAPTVDAITCPTRAFGSSKGRFSTTEPKSYYPPRDDLMKPHENDCEKPPNCVLEQTPAARFKDINELDAVAAATPPYGQPFSRTWTVPREIADGDYALLVEVSKEFDNNASHAYEAYQDPQLPDKGLRNNFGQPSVVYRVPFKIDRTRRDQAAVTDIAGYGDWDGATGNLHVPDATITAAPGSGRARLMVISQPSITGGDPLMGRVHVTTEASQPNECGPPAASDGEITGLAIAKGTLKADSATIEFVEAADGGKPVQEYDVRYAEGKTMTPESFSNATPVGGVTPGLPGSKKSFPLIGLRPTTAYVIGIRVRGGCVGQGPLATTSLVTTDIQFKQLSGCFIATAAYGTKMAPQLGPLRRVRDQVRDRSALGNALVKLYERSSPPVADLLGGSPAGRAIVRAALGPVVGALGSDRGR
jgi:hypothetical protein